MEEKTRAQNDWIAPQHHPSRKGYSGAWIPILMSMPSSCHHVTCHLPTFRPPTVSSTSWNCRAGDVCVSAGGSPSIWMECIRHLKGESSLPHPWREAHTPELCCENQMMTTGGNTLKTGGMTILRDVETWI